MVVLLLFAFLGGIVTILSPCILPILPVILSGSVGGAKTRPLGIVSGFVASFTIFTLTLTAIVRATGVSADALRYLAAGIIIIFGLIMIVPRLHEWFGTASSPIASLAQGTGPGNPGASTSRLRRSGYWSGMAMGLGLGLVWTPCVGPIMASVISLALTAKVDAGATLITLAYSVGTAIPMLAIMLGGKALLHRVPVLLRNTAGIQKAFGVLVVLTGVAIGFGWDRKLQAAIIRAAPGYGSGLTAIENVEPVKNSLSLRDTRNKRNVRVSSDELPGDYGPAPEIVTHGRWYNTEGLAGEVPFSSEKGSPPLSMRTLRGKVVLVDFWTYSCVNCVRTLPHLAAWYKAYRKDGLVIIGVHTPEFEFEKNPANVKKAIADLGVTWPVVLDNEYEQWNAYSNQYWPAHYFIDANGRIRYRHFGEGEYDQSERIIKALLKEAGSSVTAEASMPEQTIETWTPETYLGYGRASRFVSATTMAKDKTVEYKAAGAPRNGEWNLSGKWTITREYIVPENSGALQLGFQAKNVFLVIEPEMPEGKIGVQLDGVQASDTPDVRDGILLPRGSRLYQLVALKASGKHVLSLKVTGKLRLFAFTFG